MISSTFQRVKTLSVTDGATRVFSEGRSHTEENNHKEHKGHKEKEGAAFFLCVLCALCGCFPPEVQVFTTR
jgi:hypothetical protein